MNHMVIFQIFPLVLLSTLIAVNIVAYKEGLSFLPQDRDEWGLTASCILLLFIWLFLLIFELPRVPLLLIFVLILLVATGLFGCLVIAGTGGRWKRSAGSMLFLANLFLVLEVLILLNVGVTQLLPLKGGIVGYPIVLLATLLPVMASAALAATFSRITLFRAFIIASLLVILFVTVPFYSDVSEEYVIRLSVFNYENSPHDVRIEVQAPDGETYITKDISVGPSESRGPALVSSILKLPWYRTRSRLLIESNAGKYVENLTVRRSGPGYDIKFREEKMHVSEVVY